MGRLEIGRMRTGETNLPPTPRPRSSLGRLEIGRMKTGETNLPPHTPSPLFTKPLVEGLGLSNNVKYLFNARPAPEFFICLSVLHMPMCFRLVSVYVDVPGEEVASQRLLFDPQPRAKGTERAEAEHEGEEREHQMTGFWKQIPCQLGVCPSLIKGTFCLCVCACVFFKHPLKFFLFKETGS